MKRLAKILAVVVLVMVILGVSRSVMRTFAADGNLCFGPGNNLIDNISPQVLFTMRGEYAAAAEKAGGSPNCTLTATFLVRPNDFADPNSPDKSLTKLAYFLKVAQEQNILPIIRVASENSGDKWPAITAAQAQAMGASLEKAARSAGYTNTVYASFGNEVNANLEWLPGTNPESYADSFINFANQINGQNIKVLISPLILNINAQMGFAEYYRRLYTALNENLADRFREQLKKQCATLSSAKCQELIDQRVQEWLDSKISGYALNLYAPRDGTVAILTDKDNALNALISAGFNLQNKDIVITEIGIASVDYSADFGVVSCEFFQALKGTNDQIVTATIFSREGGDSRRVHAFYFPSEVCSDAKEFTSNKINIGGSTSFGGSSGYPNSVGPSGEAFFPPLGSLQACPAEIPMLSGTGGAVCGIEPKDEPAPCRDPSLVEKSKEWDDWCEGGGGSAWCYRESIDKYEMYDCSHGDNLKPEQNYGKNIDGFCLGDDKRGGKKTAQSWYAFQKACIPGSTGGANLTPDNQWKVDSIKKGDIVDRKVIEYCLGFYQRNLKERKNAAGKPLEDNQLPACLPTTYATKPYPQNNVVSQCVSECSDPLDVEQRVEMKLNAGCYQTEKGSCFATIKINEKTFNLPLAKKLANYFAGTLDGESMTEGEEEYKALVLALSKGTADPKFSEAMNAVGVAKKLIPPEIQDQLKCQFIKTVRARKGTIEAEMGTGGYGDANRQTNTKYLWWDKDELKAFKILGKPLTDIPCPLEIKNKREKDNFNRDWGEVWNAVPLFANEDAQGEIQFVSPSLFSIEPIKVSIPDVNKLNSASLILQQLFVPKARREAPPVLKTYGKEIRIPEQDLNVCRPKPVWENYYAGADYERAVLCKVSPLPEGGEGDSQICVVGIDGIINCQRDEQNPTGLEPPPESIIRNVTDEPDTKVQVRSVFPGFFDIAAQVIDPAGGLLRIFKPRFVNPHSENPAAGVPISEDEFEKHYEPLPAESNLIHYVLTDSQGLTLNDNKTRNAQGEIQDGWKILFYKLGGVWTARNFVVDLVTPGGLLAPK